MFSYPFNSLSTYRQNRTSFCSSIRQIDRVCSYYYSRTNSIKKQYLDVTKIHLTFRLTKKSKQFF